MNKTYILLTFIAVLMWNGFLIQRDRELFKAHDQACATLSKPHPDCRYSK